MAIVWPGAYDNLPTDHRIRQRIMPEYDNDQAALLNKLEEIIGLNPQGPFDTVVDRLDAVETVVDPDLNVHVNNDNYVHGTNMVDARVTLEAPINIRHEQFADLVVDTDDWTPAFNAALDLVKPVLWNFDPRGGARIYAPGNIDPYRLTADLAGDNNIEIVGDGPATCILVDYDGPAFTLTAEDAFGKRQFALRHMDFMCTDTTSLAGVLKTTAWGYNTGGFSFCTLEGIRARAQTGGLPIRGDFAYGLDLDFFIECDIDFSGNGFSDFGISFKNNSNANHTKGRIRESAVGLIIDTVTLCQLAPAFVIEGCTDKGIHLKSGALEAIGLHLENAGSGGTDLYVEQGSVRLFAADITDVELLGAAGVNTINDCVFDASYIRGDVHLGNGVLNCSFYGTPIFGTITDESNAQSTGYYNIRNPAPPTYDFSTHTRLPFQTQVPHGGDVYYPDPPTAGKGALYYAEDSDKLRVSDGASFADVP